jgi:hypothetical protein
LAYVSTNNRATLRCRIEVVEKEKKMVKGHSSYQVRYCLAIIYHFGRKKSLKVDVLTRIRTSDLQSRRPLK